MRSSSQTLIALAVAALALAGSARSQEPAGQGPMDLFIAFSRMQLLESTQGSAYEGYERTIDAHIKNLRKKIESDPKEPRLIQTVFGIGYRFARE